MKKKIKTNKNYFYDFWTNKSHIFQGHYYSIIVSSRFINKIFVQSSEQTIFYSVSINSVNTIIASIVTRLLSVFEICHDNNHFERTVYTTFAKIIWYDYGQPRIAVDAAIGKPFPSNKFHSTKIFFYNFFYD